MGNEYKEGIFLEPPTMEQLRPSVKKMVQFIHAKKIHVVVVGGASAQPVAIEVKKTWNVMFPKESLPQFIALGQVNQKVSNSKLPALVDLFHKRAVNISKINQKNCFILEEFIRSGETISLLRSVAKKVGFKKVLIGALVIESYAAILAKSLDFAGPLSLHEPKFFDLRRTRVKEFLLKRKYEKSKLIPKPKVVNNKKRK